MSLLLYSSFNPLHNKLPLCHTQNQHCSKHCETEWRPFRFYTKVYWRSVICDRLLWQQHLRHTLRLRQRVNTEKEEAPQDLPPTTTHRHDTRHQWKLLQSDDFLSRPRVTPVMFGARNELPWSFVISIRRKALPCVLYVSMQISTMDFPGVVRPGTTRWRRGSEICYRANMASSEWQAFEC